MQIKIFFYEKQLLVILVTILVTNLNQSPLLAQNYHRRALFGMSSTNPPSF